MAGDAGTALFAAAPATPSGATLAVGAAADLAWSGGESRFLRCRRTRPAEGTFGAVASVEVPSEGAIQISLSGEAWIDVIQDGHAIKSAGFIAA